MKRIFDWFLENWTKIKTVCVCLKSTCVTKYKPKADSNTKNIVLSRRYLLDLRPLLVSGRLTHHEIAGALRSCGIEVTQDEAKKITQR